MTQLAPGLSIADAGQGRGTGRMPLRKMLEGIEPFKHLEPCFCDHFQEPIVIRIRHSGCYSSSIAWRRSSAGSHLATHLSGQVTILESPTVSCPDIQAADRAGGIGLTDHWDASP